jgi:hypothetical protein
MEEPAVFDKVISLGRACDTAHQIRRYFRQTEAYPFDWLGTPFEGLLALLRHDFSGFLQTSDLESEQGCVREARYGARLRHDFPVLDPEQIAAVQARYGRRIERFRQAVAGANRILFVRGQQHIGDALPFDPAITLERTLREVFPHLDFHLLVLNPEAAALPEFEAVGISGLSVASPDPYVWSGDDAAWSVLFGQVLTRVGGRR